jgi:hypothetical protein
MSSGPVTARDSRGSDVAAFLAEVRADAQAARGRLIFGLDATASRRAAWDMAAGLQSQMFKEAATVGSLDLQLVFYRGDGECKATSWLSDPARLARIMSTIDCRAGMTQIEKILTHVQKETAFLHVGALVFIGDACEENLDTLIVKARDVGVAPKPRRSCFRKEPIPTFSGRFRTSRATQGRLWTLRCGRRQAAG